MTKFDANVGICETQAAIGDLSGDKAIRGPHLQATYDPLKFPADPGAKKKEEEEFVVAFPESQAGSQKVMGSQPGDVAWKGQ